MQAPQIGFGFLGRGAIGWFRRVRNYIRGNRGCAVITLETPAGALGLSSATADLNILMGSADLMAHHFFNGNLGIQQASVSLYAEECE
jgi:hypothetical protein